MALRQADASASVRACWDSLPADVLLMVRTGMAGMWRILGAGMFSKRVLGTMPPSTIFALFAVNHSPCLRNSVERAMWVAMRAPKALSASPR